MTKLTLIIASLAVLSSSTAFVTTTPTISSISTTSLHALTFEPPPEDNCEIDGSDCEESIFAQKRREKMEATQATKNRYRAMGVELSDADFATSVDQYQNNPTGGGLIPGMSLSALCEDD
mmetsp:Transcript_27791/g.39772  ORF Transcript_27791/g.39772 Transcript_27791/m.39772 type:complete len:120 (+) Transcript_27791:200-559(+)|eukprot:CAMPEP_0201687308 /NCGR_PEP_ID=MMETSP0578-20130828/1434_1 /ASSEMBLY_ACC=CAM_ASM_000663 /TAXON_ID=267565 /ORGANISM="Skeletonema grethea, Strain CCMP 1804" /LENGTH=119 /DNA_ID=CAMNT_0048171457 /DNA_START=114 /DNA_END=473 /DNA_ORIENTATION=+